LESKLDGEGVEYRRLHTSHAFHSPMMDPILEAFAERVAQTERRAPQMPFVSNVTGTWITEEDATDPRYWASHLRQTVRFADGVGELLLEPSRVLLEVGPGRTLSTLARRHPNATPGLVVLSSLRHPRDQGSDVAFALNALGKLWLAGVKVDWAGFSAHERRHRLPLPTYPFERQRYWIEAGELPRAARSTELSKNPRIAEWFYVPSWQRQDLPLPLPPAASEDGAKGWLVFADEQGLGTQLATRLADQGQDVVTVQAGSGFERLDEGVYRINPATRDDYDALIQELIGRGKLLAHIVHLWGVTSGDGAPAGDKAVERAQERGFYSLLFLAQALDEAGLVQPLRLDVVSTNVQEVTGEEVLRPEKATLLGPCKVMPQEYPNLTCRSIDVVLPAPGTPRWDELVEKLLAESAAEPSNLTVAYRGRHRWVQTWRRDEVAEGAARLRQAGVYLITGGLGRIGLALAEYLAQTVAARLVLVDRFAFPAPEEWERWLADHGDEDGTSRRIRRLSAIEALGAQVLVTRADVADAEQMAAAIARTYERFGALNGVVHAAGLVGERAFKAIREAGRAECEEQFQPKIRGSLVLEQVLRGRELDFCLFQSSLASVLGGLGFAAYAAANCFMDALAHQGQQSSSLPWISVNWDGWQFEEDAAVAGTSLAELTLTPEEGVLAFGHLLSLGAVPQVAVSTGDLQARLDQWVERETALPGELAQELDAADLHPRPNLATAYVAPRDELEQTIVTLWQNVLGIQQVGVYDDFFELGGHSLLATQLVSRLRDLFKAELPLRDLFENPTVAGLTGLIEASERATPDLAQPAIQTVPRDEALPLSFGQQRLWFLDQLEPGSPLYNNFAAVRLTGALDVAVLERCLNEIVRRHQALRTTFGEAAGQPAQVIAPELTLSIPLLDLHDAPPAERENQVLELAVQEGRQPFDLAQGPLMRVTLLRLGEAEHVVFMTMHHLISDGWSVGVFLGELAMLYQAFSVGEPSPLPELTIQYADYAHWQRQWLQDEVLETHLAYWKEQLDAPSVLELATDRPRPAIQTSRGANQWFELPKSLSQALIDLSQGEDATLFMTLMAALQALLYRYSGQEDVCVGTPIANRNRSETEGLIGFLLNTLVIRTDLSDDPTFRELLGRVREVALEAYAHQDLPFEMLVEALQPARDMSRSPLFQVMFDLQVAPLDALVSSGLALSPLRVDNGTAKFDLALSMEQGQEGLSGYLNYNTDLFDPDTIARMLVHFQALLEGIVADPDQCLSALPLLTPAERQKLLIEWNDTATPSKPYQSIPQLFEAQAAQRPDAIALVLADNQPTDQLTNKPTPHLTYQALNQRANQLAHHLRELGVGPDVIVGLFVERSVDTIVGLLGVAKAGGAYLPLEPANPQERLAFILQDAQAPLLLTQERLTAALPVDGTRVVRLDADWSQIAQGSAGGLDGTAAARSAAYVIYTSGSTGEPKGVLISNEAIANHCRDVQEHFQLVAGDRVLQFASLSFDQALEQVLATLVSGATLVLRGPEVWPTTEFSGVVADFWLTVVNLPPAYWHQWVQDWTTAPQPIPERQLRLVISGGDVMALETLRLWRQTPAGGARLLNAYGPTETTITALTFETPAQFDAKIPIGRPLANRKIYILDRGGNPVPVGVPGELHIGGASLALGYLNRPELTEEKFVADPFSDEPGARLYRTGDRVRYLPGGDVEFLGRVDQQVKIRGFRIELGEIEAVLGRHPDLREVAVVVREDTLGEKRLVAYLVSDREPPPVAGELRGFLKERLPDYMVPAVFVALQALPLTSSGKVDRRALPVPDLERPELEDAYVAPRTPVEEDLAQMWAEVLSLERVGIHDNFFDLGGHSLLATRLISRVRANYQVDLPLRRLFETPTVAGLSALIAESMVEDEDDEELAQLLAELEGLSEQDVQRLLTDEMSPG
jgi:amino acid adenylation domain-containing protein